MIANRALERLRAGRIAVGTTVRLPCPETIDILRQHPFDFFFVDMEHGGFGMDSLRRMLLPLGVSGIAPIVRVPDQNAGTIGQVLDLGAAGVIVPHVRSSEDARRVVNAARYPPTGSRGVCLGLRPQGYTTVEANEYIAHANASVLVVLMIESYEAVERIDEIVAVPGIDVVVIGRIDLAYDMGLGMPIPRDDRRYRDAMHRAEAAILASGLVLGGGAADAVEAEARMKAGVRFLHLQSDQVAFSRAAASLASALVEARSKVEPSLGGTRPAEDGPGR